jgi:hypothetical protein
LELLEELEELDFFEELEELELLEELEELDFFEELEELDFLDELLDLLEELEDEIGGQHGYSVSSAHLHWLLGSSQ